MSTRSTMRIPGKVLGIDPGLNCTGLVVVGTDSAVIHHEAVKTTPKHPMLERFQKISDAVLAVVSIYRPCLIVMEGPAFSQRMGAGQLDLAGLRHVVAWELRKHHRRIGFILAAPTAVKKAATGKGNCKKDMLALAIYKEFGVELPTSDEVDAYACAQFGLAQLRAADQPQTREEKSK